MVQSVQTHCRTLRARTERGQGLVEYSLILAIVSIASIALLILLGPLVADLLQVALDAIS